MYITIKDFARLHNVTPHAIQAAIHSGRIKYKEQFGIYTISDKAKYTPVLGRGRKKQTN